VGAVTVGAIVAVGSAVAVGVAPPNGPQAASERATVPIRHTLTSERKDKSIKRPPDHRFQNSGRATTQCNSVPRNSIVVCGVRSLVNPT
jgi:hypothetical protein